MCEHVVNVVSVCAQCYFPLLTPSKLILSVIKNDILGQSKNVQGC